MSDFYMLNTRGLTYLTSSSDSSAIRRFLLYILVLNSKQSITMQQLVAWNGRSSEVVSRLVDKMLELGWLKTVDKDEYKYSQIKKSLQTNDFSILSSTQQVLLADVNGLVILNQGFDDHIATSVAANATHMLSINEVSRQRNIDLYNGQPWAISLHWGALRLRAQYICLGTRKYVLVLGGKPQLDKPEFFTLVSMLHRRYVHE